MATIPYPDPANVPGLAEVYERVSGIGRPVINLYRVMGHSPAGLGAYIGLSHFVRDNSSLPPALRELAILQTGVTLRCDYEATHHVLAARRAGLPETKIQAVLEARSEGFDGTELAVLDYAREVAESRSVSDRTLAAVRRQLTMQQISDLAITVGMYHMCAAILLPLQVETDA